MKSFLWTIFLLIFLTGSGYLIWWQTPVKAAFVKWGLVPDSAESDDDVDGDGEQADTGGGGTTPGGSTTPNNNGGGGGTDPIPGTPSTTPPKPTISDAELARKYPLPDFRPFTYYTQTKWANWSAVPNRVFPKSVRVKKNVTIKLPAGTATRQAGSEVYPVSLSNPNLVVSISPGGSIRGTVNVNDTTFKEDIKAVYDRNVEKARNRVLQRRAAAKTGTVSQAATKFTEEQITDLGPKPSVGAGGEVALMRASFDSGEIEDFKKATILRWSPVTANKVGEISCWTATVVYNRQSFFGTIEAEAMAMMRNGRILKWVYVGTDEEIE